MLVAAGLQARVSGANAVYRWRVRSARDADSTTVFLDREGAFGQHSFHLGQLRRAQVATSSRMSCPAQRSSTIGLPGLAQLRHDLMRHTQVPSDLRRDHTTPKQVSRSHAAFFHRLENHADAEPVSVPNRSVPARCQHVGPCAQCLTNQHAPVVPPAVYFTSLFTGCSDSLTPSARLASCQSVSKRANSSGVRRWTRVEALSTSPHQIWNVLVVRAELRSRRFAKVVFPAPCNPQVMNSVVIRNDRVGLTYYAAGVASPPRL